MILLARSTLNYSIVSIETPCFALQVGEEDASICR
jgi:hypothetical protein